MGRIAQQGSSQVSQESGFIFPELCKGRHSFVPAQMIPAGKHVMSFAPTYIFFSLN